MGKEKRAWKFFSWNTVFVLLMTCVLNTVIWIGFHGVPLMGVPQKENVESVTILCNDTGNGTIEKEIPMEQISMEQIPMEELTMKERTVTDDENIELLVKASSLLNYRIFGEKEEVPVIVVTYHLKNGDSICIGANRNTMWWHGKSHAIKEKDVFVNIIQGLFFSDAS